ncbi:hypothetical protein MKW98_005479 [Papaver atlanticum]|uniref:Uncharacterized protein n=1 Tax=Papaver atlanticum TaxID=357466 RepID=A0AAD4T8U7_9MAGN|nr:hypothetical protein MKW98_005479 [Papaver atlanticum]
MHTDCPHPSKRKERLLKNKMLPFSSRMKIYLSLDTVIIHFADTAAVGSHCEFDDFVVVVLNDVMSMLVAGSGLVKLMISGEYSVGAIAGVYVRMEYGMERVVPTIVEISLYVDLEMEQMKLFEKNGMLRGAVMGVLVSAASSNNREL